MTRAALIAALALSGCATIAETPPPTDWPRMKIIEHRVAGYQAIAHCYKYTPLWMKLTGGFSLACAEFYFAQNECHIWVESEERGFIYEHEREHCEGRDHSGSDDIAKLWESYKNARR